MDKYIVEPEVAGQLGERTILKYETKPPIIEKLHYEFDDWLGDDFLAGFQCFICTERLANSLVSNNLTGFKLNNCKVTKSQLFYDLNENDIDLPSFYWIQINGNEDDDFYIIANATLVISQRTLEILKNFDLSHCDVTEFR